LTRPCGRALPWYREAAYPRPCRPEPCHKSLTWPCTRRGLPCRIASRRSRCALTAPFHPYPFRRGGVFSVALSLSRRDQITITPGWWALPTAAVQWCSDFPPLAVG